MNEQKFLVTGSTGMVGQAVMRELQKNSHPIFHPTHAELDLCNQTAVFDYFAQNQPDIVFHLAAIVGGIHANNTYPAKFIYDNTQMHCNVIAAAHKFQVKKILFPGSACTYPKFAPQPVPESAFLDGQIEPTNIAYAAAKINGLIMCQAYARQHGLSVLLPMPTNAYGVGDNFNPEASHVIPALMKRFHEAKLSHAPVVQLWGSGKVLREFIYVDDLANALVFLAQNYESSEIINVGTMQEISILNLAQLIAKTVGYQGEITLDLTKPDGAPRKCLDATRLFNLGWQPKVSLHEGLQKMYEYHFANDLIFQDLSSQRLLHYCVE